MVVSFLATSTNWGHSELNNARSLHHEMERTLERGGAVIEEAIS